jgi:hypothetical protein
MKRQALLASFRSAQIHGFNRGLAIIQTDIR